MKLIKLLLLTLLLPAVVPVSELSAQEAKGIISKVQLPGTNYCHLKFPPIRRDTLYTDRPVLADPSSGNIIDFYGPCDYDPLGKEQILRHKQDRSRTRRREWGDN